MTTEQDKPSTDQRGRRVAEVEYLIERFKGHLQRYLPGGDAEMTPGNRPYWLGRAFEDKSLQSYVVAFLKIHGEPSMEKTIATLGLYGLPDELTSELYNWLLRFQSIYVADYRDAIIRAAATRQDLRNPESIDPHIGGLNLFESAIASGLRRAGASSQEARGFINELETARHRQKGCLGALFILCVLCMSLALIAFG